MLRANLRSGICLFCRVVRGVALLIFERTLETRIRGREDQGEMDGTVAVIVQAERGKKKKKNKNKRLMCLGTDILSQNVRQAGDVHYFIDTNLYQVLGVHCV